MLFCRMAGFAASVLIAAAILQAQTQPKKPASSEDAKLVKEFESRVNNYVGVRKKEAGTSPKSTTSSVKLTETEKQIAANEQAQRSDAKQGDIFTPEIAGYFRRQIAATLNGPDGRKIRLSLKHSEPVKGRLQVNQKYPAKVPLQSTPPTLLLNLPKLPKDLEYRIVGNDLVLHDIVSNLVVDFVPGAIPAS